MTTKVPKSQREDVRFGPRENEPFDQSVTTRQMTDAEYEKYFGGKDVNTKDEYLKLKDEGKTDKEIRDLWNIHNMTLYKKKQEWGLIGKFKPGGRGGARKVENEGKEKDEPVPEDIEPATEPAQRIVEATKSTDYEEIGREIGKLVAEKNKAYGDAFHKSDEFLQLLYPDGIETVQYSDMLAVVRVFDKLMRIANQKDAFGESPWKDVAGYGILKSREVVE